MSKLQDLESFWIGEYIYMLGEWCFPAPQRQKPLCSGPFSFALCPSSSGCSSVFFYYILYNKQVNVNKCFPKFYEPLQQMIEPDNGVIGPPNF